MNIAHHSYTRRWLVPLTLMLLVAACTNTDRKALRRAEMTERALERTQQNRVRIPRDPVQLRHDYAHPLFTIRQAFRWSPYATEWRLMVVDYTAVYAGFHVKQPIELPPQREGMALYFELWPPEAARSLAIGLIDDSEKEPGHIHMLPVASYRVERLGRDTRSAFAIPLSDFESETFIANARGDFEKSAQQPNWDNIRGVHVHRLVRKPDHARQIIIRNLQLAPLLWVNQIQRGVTP